MMRMVLKNMLQLITDKHHATKSFGDEKRVTKMTRRSRMLAAMISNDDGPAEPMVESAM